MSGFDLIVQPDEDDAEAAEVLVDGSIGGYAYRFLLDTGAAKTRVRFDGYTSTFTSTERDSSSGVFASGSYDLITVPGIELGPISRSDFTLVRLPENGPDRRNLIGMDLLKDFRCHFLFDENQVMVDPEDAAAPGYSLQPLLLDARAHPYIEIRFGSLKASAVWDTGAGITVADTNFIEKHPRYFQEAGQSRGTDSTGAEARTPMFMMAATIIGDLEMSPQKVAGVDMSGVNSTLDVPMDVILGYNTLSKANWLMDFPRKQWAILKSLG